MKHGTFYVAWLALAAALWPAIPVAAAAIDSFPPPLRQLRAQHAAQYGRTLDDYAGKQGFKAPIERMGTVLHEMIHVDSYVHQGYFIDGVYYEPYTNGWPRLTNKDVTPTVAQADRDLVYTSYALRTPDNHLGNVLDELNAYGHVAPTICVNEPTSGPKQVMNIMGFLRLQEAHLKVLRTTMAGEYERMRKGAAQAGAIRLITQRAWDALRVCGQAVGAIPRSEVGRLF